ncbi:MAG TPA: fimbria/pilus outer membrane usher protein [Vicinamibacterales bacterium]
MRRSLGTILAAALLAAAPAVAQERSIWALVINDEPKGDVEILLTADGPWVDPSVLVAAGLLRVPDGRRQVFAPDTLVRVSLASLAPDITFTLDEEEIRLLISADPVLLGTTEVAVSNPRPPGWKVSSNKAVFLNYSSNWSTDDKASGYGELGVHLFGAVFETAATIDDTGTATLGLTSLTFDQVRSRRRWVLGDTIGRSTSLGSAPVVGGFSVSTKRDLDPYYAMYPAPQIRGAVRTPSTADVYVDGRLVSSVRLPPGRFTLSDLPIETGLGNARVIIRDAFGRQQSIDLGFYLSTQLLKGGVQDYSYVAGWERTSSGTTVEYGRAMGTAVHNIGLTDWLTIGFQAEGAKDVAMGGAGFNARIWRLGTFGAEGLASQTPDADQGYAVTGVYSFLSDWFTTEMRGTWIGPRFQNLFLLPANHQQVTADASATLSLGRLGSLTFGGTLGGPEALTARISQINPDLIGRLPETLKRRLEDALATRHDKLLRVGYTLSVLSRAQLSMNATRVDKAGSPVGWEGFASLTVALGWRTVASAVTTVDVEGEALTSINLQRSLPLGPGFGFRVDADAQDPYRTQGPFEVQSRRAILGVRADGSQDDKTVGTINLAGSIVAIGGELLLSRPVDDGFALVKVPNSRGVGVLANNQSVGRTGRRGSLFVPDLRSYLSSPIGIVQDDLPVEMRLGATTQDVAVPYRGGAVVVFEANPIRALTGRLDVAGKAPEYGTLSLTVGATAFSSPLNATGEFYFEDLPPGDHPGVASWSDRTCRATIRMPAQAPPLTDAGVVTCVEEPR